VGLTLLVRRHRRLALLCAAGAALGAGCGRPNDDAPLDRAAGYWASRDTLPLLGGAGGALHGLLLTVVAKRASSADGGIGDRIAEAWLSGVTASGRRVVLRGTEATGTAGALRLAFYAGGGRGDPTYVTELRGAVAGDRLTGRFAGTSSVGESPAAFQRLPAPPSLRGEWQVGGSLELGAPLGRLDDVAVLVDSSATPVHPAYAGTFTARVGGTRRVDGRASVDELVPARDGRPASTRIALDGEVDGTPVHVVIAGAFASSDELRGRWLVVGGAASSDTTTVRRR
jgi:hypothetical protein